MERLKKDQHKTNAVKKIYYPTMKRGGILLSSSSFSFINYQVKAFGQEGELSCVSDQVRG
jgi:hypothetical protein